MWHGRPWNSRSWLYPAWVTPVSCQMFSFYAKIDLDPVQNLGTRSPYPMVTTTRPTGYTSATRVLEQQYLTEDEIAERLTIPGDLRAQATEVSPRAKIEETADGEVHVRFNGDKKQSFTIAGPEAMESLFSFTGVPKSMGKEYPSKLITPLLTHALQKKDGVVTVTDGDLFAHKS